jgi:predicted metal-dependent phosphoesterase TrpH
MLRAKERGLEVLVLADHNSVGWAAEMQAAGARHGIVVFPGFEVTTASGADGAHLIVFADPTSDVEPLKNILISACGFGLTAGEFLGHVRVNG